MYDISILSGLPSSVSDLLPLEPLPTRIRPLFSVGVHDMQTLAQGSRDQSPDSNLTDDSMGYGWLANTTDDILSLKDHLYDILVTIPPPYTKQAQEKVWPKLDVKKGTELKATQRDLRRYHVLLRELRRFPSSRSPNMPKSTTQLDPQPFTPIENSQETYDDASSTLDAELAEPQSWSALAYSSFMWWASAGEKRTDLDEEEEYDAALLRHLDTHNDDSSPNRPRSSAKKSPGRSPGMEAMDTQPAGLEMSIIAYFHRLTTLILKTLADIIDAAGFNDDEANKDGSIRDGDTNGDDSQSSKKLTVPSNGNEEVDAIFVNSEDMTRMGLDIWSENDRSFVKELVAFYWGRKAEVRGGRVECCGVRIC